MNKTDPKYPVRKISFEGNSLVEKYNARENAKTKVLVRRFRMRVKRIILRLPIVSSIFARRGAAQVDVPQVLRDIYVIYRHYPERRASKEDTTKYRPLFFTFQNCFRNLMDTIAYDPMASRVNVIVLFDGSSEELFEDFAFEYLLKQYANIDVQLIEGGGTLRAFMNMLEIVKDLPCKPHDIIYLLENDYLHQNGWVSKIFDLYESASKFDYVSLYDHPDYYKLPAMKKFPVKIIPMFSHHWRTAPSTCASFLMSKSIFDRDYSVFRMCVPDEEIFDILVRQRCGILLTPIPSLSTHCMAEHLAPAVTWHPLSSQETKSSPI